MSASLRHLLQKAMLPAVVVGASALSLYWVFLVPIFESPDEHEHLDYAFNIYSAGRLITVRDAFRPDGDIHHDYTLYLAGVADLNAVHNGAKMNADYGSTRYFRIWIRMLRPREHLIGPRGLATWAFIHTATTWLWRSG